jgi:hypothetical protein
VSTIPPNEYTWTSLCLGLTFDVYELAAQNMAGLLAQVMPRPPRPVLTAKGLLEVLAARLSESVGDRRKVLYVGLILSKAALRLPCWCVLRFFGSG